MRLIVPYFAPIDQEAAMPSRTPKKQPSSQRKSQRIPSCSNISASDCTRLGVTPRATRVSKKRTSAVPADPYEENDSSPPKLSNLSVAGFLPSRALLSSTFCEPLDQSTTSRTGRSKPLQTPTGDRSVSRALASLQLDSPPRRHVARTLRLQSTAIEEELVESPSPNCSDSIRQTLTRRLFAEQLLDERSLMSDPVARYHHILFQYIFDF